LETSEALAIADNYQYSWGFHIDLLRVAIHWHHKIFPHRGFNQNVIEACRKADRIDASKGKLLKGMSLVAIAEVEAEIPNLGFHDSLIRQAKDCVGSTIDGGLKMTLGIVKW
jgi:hypothetical protein